MKKIIIFCLTLISGLYIVSCDDLLDNPPLDKIENEAFWKRADD